MAFPCRPSAPKGIGAEAPPYGTVIVVPSPLAVTEKVPVLLEV
jgi:hypothetical protein